MFWTAPDFNGEPLARAESRVVMQPCSRCGLRWKEVTYAAPDTLLCSGCLEEFRRTKEPSTSSRFDR